MKSREWTERKGNVCVCVGGGGGGGGGKREGRIRSKEWTERNGGRGGGERKWW